jgi:hypothetical protein
LSGIFPKARVIHFKINADGRKERKTVQRNEMGDEELNKRTEGDLSMARGPEPARDIFLTDT